MKIIRAFDMYCNVPYGFNERQTQKQFCGDARKKRRQVWCGAAQEGRGELGGELSAVRFQRQSLEQQ
jgi:hypothetical protein